MRLCSLPRKRERESGCDTALTIILLSFGLRGEFGASHDITRHIEKSLMSNIPKSGHEELVPAFGNPDLRYATLIGEGAVGMEKHVGALYGGLRVGVEYLDRHLMVVWTDDLHSKVERAGGMRHMRLHFRAIDAPLLVSSPERGLRVHLGEIKRARARPDIVTQACSSHLRTFVVEDAQRPASQLASG